MPTPSGHTSAIRATTVTGTDVHDASGRKIGEIEDIMLDKLSNNIMFAVVSFGGFLGMAEKYHPLPWSSLKFDKSKDSYVVELHEGTARGRARGFASTSCPATTARTSATGPSTTTRRRATGKRRGTEPADAVGAARPVASSGHAAPTFAQPRCRRRGRHGGPAAHPDGHAGRHRRSRPALGPARRGRRCHPGTRVAALDLRADGPLGRLRGAALHLRRSRPPAHGGRHARPLGRLPRPREGSAARARRRVDRRLRPASLGGSARRHAGTGRRIAAAGARALGRARRRAQASRARELRRPARLGPDPRPRALRTPVRNRARARVPARQGHRRRARAPASSWRSTTGASSPPRSGGCAAS